MSDRQRLELLRARRDADQFGGSIATLNNRDQAQTQRERLEQLRDRKAAAQKELTRRQTRRAAAQQELDRRNGTQGGGHDFGRHKRNVKKMVDAGAPEADIDAYLSGEGITAEMMRNASPSASKSSDGKAPRVINGPDGRKHKFPADMSFSDIDSKLRHYYGKPERQTATNPKTGERLELVDGKWQPLKSDEVKTATNHATGERLKLVNGSWEPFEEDKPSIGDRVGAAAGGFLKGMTLNASDHIEAGLASVVPIDRMISLNNKHEAKFLDYKGNLKSIRARNQAQKEGAPGSYKAGEIGGAFAGVGKALNVGATVTKAVPKGLSGAKKFVATGGALAADGAVIAGTSSALDGQSAEDVMKSVKTGAAFGVGGHAALKFGGAIGSRLQKMFLKPQQKATNAVIDAAQKGGKSAEDIRRSFQSAADDGANEFMLLDAMGDAGVRQANGISRVGGEGGRMIRNALDNRQAGQSGRVANMIDEGFGANGQTAAQASQGITKTLQKTDNANFGNIPKQAVDPARAKKATAVANTSKGQMTKIEKRMNGFSKIIGNKATSTDRLIAIRKQVSDDADKAFRGGQSELGTKLKELKAAIDDDILQVSPAYQKANKQSSKIRGVRDAIGQGQSAATKGRAGDVTDGFSKMSVDQKQAFRVGMADKLSGKVEAQAIGADASRAMQSDRFKEIASVVLPNAEKFGRQISRESDMFANRARISGGSQTADNLADTSLVSIVPALMKGNFQAALGTTFAQAKNRLTGLDDATRTEIARMLISRSDDKFVAEAARKLARDQKLNKGQVQLIYGAIVMSAVETE